MKRRNEGSDVHELSRGRGGLVSVVGELRTRGRGESGLAASESKGRRAEGREENDALCSSLALNGIRLRFLRV